MNKQSQWLFEAPFVSESDLYTNPEYYSDSEWEAEWELQGYSDVGFLLSEEEWEVTAGSIPGFSSAEEKALRITSTFETGRPLSFGGLTGNFDRMEVSFGLMQWNIGSRSLQPLLWKFAQRHPKNFDAVFGVDASQLRQILQQFNELGRTKDPSEQKRIMTEQMRFAISINDQQCDPKNKSTHKFCKLVAPWASYFRRLEVDSAFQQIQLRQVRKSMDVAVKYVRQFGLQSERGLALMFDIVTQAGGAWLTKKSRATLIKQGRAKLQQQLGRSLTEREMLTIIANVVANTSLPEWREKVRVRKMAIVKGHGKVQGKNFDLSRKPFELTEQPWELTSGTTQQEFLFETETAGFVPIAVENPGGRRIQNKRDPNSKDIVSVQGMGGEILLHRLAANAWQALVAEARAAGIKAPSLLPVSGYRSSKRQNQLWQEALKKYGSADKARQWVAPPGSSAHQSGRAIDLWLGFRVSSKNVQKMFATPAYKWLVKNAAHFGFYPYSKEPWHWEYNPPI